MCERLVGKLFFSTLFTVFLFYFEGPIKIQVKLSHIVKENPETTHTIYKHHTSQQVVIPTRHMLLPHKGSRSRYFGYVQTPDWVQEKITNEGKHDVWLKFRTLRSSGWQRRVTLPSNPAPCPSCLSVPCHWLKLVWKWQPYPQAYLVTSCWNPDPHIQNRCCSLRNAKIKSTKDES